MADSALPAMGLAPNPVRRYVLRSTSAAGSNAPILAQLDFGSPNTNNPGTICARRSDLAEDFSVYAVNNADFDRLPSTAYQLRRHRIWEFDASLVTNLQIQANGQARIWEHRKENVWVPKTSGISDNQAKGMYMENLVNNLGFLEAAAWVGPGEPTEEYGFNGNSLKISLALAKGSQSTTLTVTFGAPVTAGSVARYACTKMEDGQNWIFIYSAKDVDELTTYLPTDN